MYNTECNSPSSFIKEKLKLSICCFRTTTPQHSESSSSLTSSPSTSTSTSSPRSPYTWLKSTAQELEIKDKCRNLISRMGNRSRKHHNNLADFRYDPLSYALNFEDEQSRVDQYPISFSSRLPISPERLTASAKCGDTPVVTMSKPMGCV